MKKFLLILLLTTLTFASVDQRLQNYQHKYSVCHGKTNTQIATCLLNGNLNFSQFRGDKNAYRKVSTRKIRRANKQGTLYAFTMQHLPKTRRYLALKEYVDYLYSIRKGYVTPRFKGDVNEDTLRIIHIFNLLQNANLPLVTQRDILFEDEVKEYQRRHGLAIDGDIGPQTKHSLQQTMGQILRKVKKNLTLESVSTPKPSAYILVNIPEFQMHFYENQSPILSMRVVVGKKKMRTPVFNRKMKYIVKNPRWNVPKSIYYKEYANKSEATLRKKGFAYNSEGKLYQKSGPRNALGRVKFLFPNRFNVYMHDTPAKSYFKRRYRAYSHGCIRLERPMDLLNTLGYSYDTKKNKWHTLKHKVPVFVEYHTVWVDDFGVVQFRPDVYGYERKLFR